MRRRRVLRCHILIVFILSTSFSDRWINGSRLPLLCFVSRICLYRCYLHARQTDGLVTRDPCPYPSVSSISQRLYQSGTTLSDNTRLFPYRQLTFTISAAPSTSLAARVPFHNPNPPISSPHSISSSLFMNWNEARLSGVLGGIDRYIGDE